MAVDHIGSEWGVAEYAGEGPWMRKTALLCWAVFVPVPQ